MTYFCIIFIFISIYNIRINSPFKTIVVVSISGIRRKYQFIAHISWNSSLIRDFITACSNVFTQQIIL